jgi:hypothetical protein
MEVVTTPLAPFRPLAAAALSSFVVVLEASDRESSWTAAVRWRGGAMTIRVLCRGRGGQGAIKTNRYQGLWANNCSIESNSYNWSEW